MNITPVESYFSSEYSIALKRRLFIKTMEQLLSIIINDNGNDISDEIAKKNTYG